MRQLKHPLSGAIYELDADGNVVVSRPGASGVFTRDGAWLGGEICQADPELCRWIKSGDTDNPRLKASRRYTALTSTLGTGS